MNMPFKSTWEKTQLHTSLTQDQIERAFKMTAPRSTLEHAFIIEGGCANLNVKVIPSGESTPQLLRFYIRDASSAYREKAIGDRLSGILLVPKTHYIGIIDGITFALTDFVEGIPLRDLLLSDETYDVSKTMFDIGRLLIPLTHVKFDESGFIDHNLKIQNIFPLGFPEILLNQCLQTKSVIMLFEAPTIQKIKNCTKYFNDDSLESPPYHLVHGDFNPANILMIKQGQNWIPSALLDFEFAYAGSILGDIASMLREAHLMPDAFSKGFLDGIQSGNIQLPPHWRRSTHLLNILALIEMASRCDLEKMPQQAQDIFDLVIHHLNELESYD